MPTLRWLVFIVALALVGCIGATALAQGSDTAAGFNWPALNAIVNFTNLVGTAVVAAVALFVRWLKGQVASILSILGDIRDWQERWTKAAEMNMKALAVEQKEAAVGCIAVHGDPPPGRPKEPREVSFEWPEPPRRRSTDQN